MFFFLHPNFIAFQSCFLLQFLRTKWIRISNNFHQLYGLKKSTFWNFKFHISRSVHSAVDCFICCALLLKSWMQILYDSKFNFSPFIWHFMWKAVIEVDFLKTKQNTFSMFISLRFHFDFPNVKFQEHSKFQKHDDDDDLSLNCELFHMQLRS